MTWSNTSTRQPMESRLQWVPHGPRAKATQRENEMVRMLARVSPHRRAMILQREEIARAADFETTVLAAECINAGIEVERASAVHSAARCVLMAAVTREAKAVAAARRCRLRRLAQS